MLDSRLKALARAKRNKITLQRELKSAKRTLDQINVHNSALAHQNKMNANVMLGMKVRMETAESELERLKRKRTDSISPERAITSILKRPAAPPPSEPLAAGKDILSSSAQPTPKKSRTRKERWNDTYSSSAPPTSSNKNGFNGNKEHTSPARKKDPVLDNSPNSFRRKQDIIEEIQESAKTLGLSRQDTSLVFHRSSVQDQIRVTKKVPAYVELLISATCVHLLKSSKFTGNPVQAYLDTLSLSQKIALKTDVEGALEQCEDSNRHMAAYSGGDDLARRIRQQCFAKDGTPLRPHKLNDSMQRLHERLGCHSQHSIPIGFFYAKWCEKLHFHLARVNRQRSLSTASSTRTRTPSPTPAPQNISRPSVAPIIASSSAATRDVSIKEAEANLNDIKEERAAIFDETKDGLLMKKDKAVFWYRQGRRRE